MDKWSQRLSTGICIIIILLVTVKKVKASSYSCDETKKTVEIVDDCPDSAENWKKAAARKNCSAHANQCNEPEKFVYHCVINAYVNQTLEVCGYVQNIVSGYCTEYNVLGNLIQSNPRTICKTFNVKPCPIFYRSNEAYKYPVCYELTKASTTLADETKSTTHQVTHTSTYMYNETIVLAGNVSSDVSSTQSDMRPEIQNKDNLEEYGSGLEDSEILDNMPPSEPVFNINPENKEIKTLRETCKSLRDQVRELEDVINKQASDSVKLKEYQRRLNDSEERNKDLISDTKLLSARIKTLESQLLDLKDLRKINKELKEENKCLKQEIKVLVEKPTESSLMQKRKQKIHVNSQEETMTSCEVKKKKTQETQPDSKTVSTKIIMALVEYNDKKVYLGELSSGNDFTFARSPLGKLDIPIIWTQTKDTSFILNPRDRVKLDPAFIVCKFECQKVKNNLIIEERHKTSMIKGIASYNKK